MRWRGAAKRLKTSPQGGQFNYRRVRFAERGRLGTGRACVSPNQSRIAESRERSAAAGIRERSWSLPVKGPSPFDELFVLELANNHWGRLDRGLRIVRTFGEVVRRNGVRAAIKLQFRDIGSFMHERPPRPRRSPLHQEDHRHRAVLGGAERPDGRAVRAEGMVTMVTPFDEVSVDRCVEFGVEILKIASSDIRDWHPDRKMPRARKPVIASSGGSNLDRHRCARRLLRRTRHSLRAQSLRVDLSLAKTANWKSTRSIS